MVEVISQRDIMLAMAWSIGVLLVGGATVAWFFLQYGVNVITKALNNLSAKVNQMERHFNDRLLGIDRRVTRVETKLGLDTPMPPIHTTDYHGAGRRSDDPVMGD